MSAPCGCKRRRLGGAAECCCRRCKNHFSSPGNFDRHFRPGHCLDPATLGLIPAPRAHGEVWSTAAEIAQAERLTAKRAS